MKPFSHNRRCSKFELGCRFEGAVEFWETEETPLTPERANSSRLLDFELSPQFPFKQCTSYSPPHTLGILQTHFSKLQPISLSFDSPPSMKNSFSSTHIDSTYIKQEIFAENSDSNDFRSSFFAIQSSADNVDTKTGSDPRFANSFALSIVGVTGASAFTFLR
jgi:hypothetical protein